ncbi:MAG: class II fructose-bisphosphate aldolase, partial [Gammaproteobacteria bacterium]|nr:class II fructose-bisphosphate aldolase [Gammaproteobacteria bacterium]
AESHFEHYDFELAMAATVAAARRASAPLAIHLDHGASLDSVKRAIALGCNGVMVDASTLPFAENVKTTRAVVAMAHGCGAPVEGELGYVAGVEGEDAEKHPGEAIYTSPEEAEAYVEQTGVDVLAVSVGTVHGRLRGVPQLDFARLRQINERLRIPLVIHGGTGLTDEQFRTLVKNGVAKINYYTALSDAAAARIRENARTTPDGGYTSLLRGVREVIGAEVERCMKLWGGAGRATQVLNECRLWREVEHVIIYNLKHGLTDADAEQIMARGRAELADVPGVRRVFSGRAAQDQAPYRYCWLIRFASESVIENYRVHPTHRQFADGQFRPVAQDRVSIDFEAVE